MQKINKGVGPPKPRIRHDYQFGKMRPGKDSFDVEIIADSHSLRTGIYQAAKREGYSVTIRRVGDVLRVWVVEKVK